MPSTPLPIGLTVRIDGVATANLNVTCRNENTDQSKSLNTASDGKLIFNLGSTVDFSKGWNVGDKILVYSIYRTTEQKFSFTIPETNTSIAIKDASNVDVGSFTGGSGMSNGFLDLVAVPDAPSLRYFTTQEFLDHYEFVTKEVDAENGIDLLQLTRIGESVEEQIDSDTLTKFDDNNGAFYSPSAMEGGESPEHHDAIYNNQRDYFTDFIPINSVSAFEINQNEPEGAPNFDTLTDTTDNEIRIDKQTGRIQIVNSGKFAEVGPRQVRITYTFGRATTPTDIRMLAIIETGRRMLGAEFLRSRVKGFKDTELGDVTAFDTFRNRIIKKYKNHVILST